MPDRILKVTRSGSPLLEGRALDLDQLDQELARLRESGERLVYYREAPLTPPEPGVLELVERLLASGVELVTADQVQSEWGDLGGFCLYQAPTAIRLKAERGGRLSFAWHPEGAPRPKLLEMELPQGERLMAQLDLLVRSDRILELPQKNTERAFQQDEVESPSVHLRVEYMDRGRWLSWYAPDDVPDNVVSLIEDCHLLGQRILGKATGEDPGEDAEGSGSETGEFG